jgi:hypothetical protein
MDRGPEYLLYKIIDNIVDDCFPIIERLGERIDELEDEIFLSKSQVTTEEILTLKRTIILLRKVLIPQRRIFSNVNGRYSFFINEDNVPYYLDLIDHLDSILDTANTYRDLANSLMETYYSIISSRTSEIITILTIISIIMMPLTVITGFFGMNVKLPSHSPYTMWYILFGMITLAIAMLGFFRNRGETVVLEDPDREQWVQKAVANARKWLATPDAKWEEGLDAAETAANLLESAQLTAMREPPTRTIDLLRRGKPDLPALRAAIEKYIAILEPYQHTK